MSAMPSGVRLRVAVISVLPVLFPALLLLTILAMLGLMPWPVVPAVAVALLVQALLAYLRLGHPEDRRGWKAGPAVGDDRHPGHWGAGEPTAPTAITKHRPDKPVARRAPHRRGDHGEIG